jgi:hypothetical protein
VLLGTPHLPPILLTALSAEPTLKAGEEAMYKQRRVAARAFLVGACALVIAPRAAASGVPIGGYAPLVGIGLTNEFRNDFDTFAYHSSQPPLSATKLGQGGIAHYDIALLDTGAGFSLLTSEADFNFNIDGPYSGEPDGFRGTESIQFGGATGGLIADINDPLGLYAGGLQGLAGTAPFTMNNSALRGQTNTSLLTIPASSDLPNVVGLTFASQYATYIRNDMPQIFELNGRTVRTPSIDFLALGSGGQGIARRAPLTLNPGSGFLGPPTWFYNFENLDIDNPHENPSYPTLLQSGSGGAFLTVTAQNEGQTLANSDFLFDTGAAVTVVSELNAALLGFDVVLDEPEFTIAVVGSGGTTFDVPGFFVDQLTVLAVGGNVTLTNVPVLALDVTNPGDPGNVVPGIIGTNVIAGRNVVFDPKPSDGTGGAPYLYISDPVTIEKNWTTGAPNAAWSTGGNWNGSTAPDTLSIANVRHVAGGNQTAIVSADATVWELNVSGTASQTMTVEVQNGVRLTTFTGVNIEEGGVVDIQNGTLDADFVQVTGGTLRGAGLVTTGNGTLPGQVESRSGNISPGNGIGELEIIGRFALGGTATLAIDLAGVTAGTQYDQIIVEGDIALGGTLAVTLGDLGGGMFVPSVGNSFTILTATGAIDGTFATLLLPDGFQWDVEYDGTDVVLSVVGVGLVGDFNVDGVVDAADYVAWRKNGGTLAEYQAWTSSFGMSTGSGAGHGRSAAVPEPGTLSLILLAAGGFACRRRPVNPTVRCGASTQP